MLKRKNRSTESKKKKVKLTEAITSRDMLSYVDKGYAIIENPVLTSSECKLLRKKAFEFTNLMFDDEEVQVDPSKPETLKLLTDKNYRALHLENPNCIYVGGVANERPNTRQPYMSKTTGMAHQYYGPEKSVLVDSNPLMYQVASTLYEEKQLKLEPSRFSIKAPGSNDMLAHLDCGLFDMDYKVNTRIQSMVVVDRPTDVNTRDSGTIEIIPRFHLYFKLAQQFLHPETGYKKYRYPAKYKNKYQSYMTPKLFNLEKFNKYINVYTKIQNKKETTKKGFYKHACKVMSKTKIWVPPDFKPLKWKAIKIPVGHMFIWDSCLPHRNLRNKSTTRCRIVYYYCTYRQEDKYHLTDKFKKIKDDFSECTPFHYEGMSAEPAYCKKVYDSDYVIDGNYKMFKTQSSLYKALIGFDRNTYEDYTWENFRNKKN